VAGDIVVATSSALVAGALRGDAQAPLAVADLELAAEQEGYNPATEQKQELEGFYWHRT
jgi:hypothetical protein